MTRSSGDCPALDPTLVGPIPVTAPPQRRVVVFLLLALAALLHLTMIWAPLGNGREGWEAATARQMAWGQSPAAIAQSWGEPVQPSLATWLTVFSFRWLGPSEFAARLPEALAVTGVCWLVFLLAERLGGLQRGLIAGVIAATTSGPLLHGKIIGAGSLFTVFMVMAGYAVIRMLEQNPRRTPWVWCFWLGLTLAVISTGPEILPVPLLVLGPLCLFFREARIRLAVLISLRGLLPALFAAAAFAAWSHWHPWWMAATAGNGAEMARPGAALFWMFFPWSVILLPPLLWRFQKVLRFRSMECGEAVIWLWLLAALLWSVLTGVPEEWPLPVAVTWPALAVVSALVWERINSGLRMMGCALLILAGVAGLVFGGYWAGAEWLRLLQPIWWLSCGVMMVFGLAALVFVRQRHSLAALLALAAAVIPLGFNLLDARARHAWRQSFKETAAVWPLREAAGSGVLLDDAPLRVSSFLFYAEGDTRFLFKDQPVAAIPQFVLTPRTRLDFWMVQTPGAIKSGENGTHYLLRLPH